MPKLSSLVVDWSEQLLSQFQDPESVAAGETSPHDHVSDSVWVSDNDGFYVYHVGDDQLGHGSSLGNDRAWMQTKGTGDMLSLFSVEAGANLLGGLSVSFQLPFSDLSMRGRQRGQAPADHQERFGRAMTAKPGQIHLHPAYQQRQFIIGDGLEVLETLYLPRWGESEPDPACAIQAVQLRNHRLHPIQINVVATLDLGGMSEHDIVAHWNPHERALVAHDTGDPRRVRFFGADPAPDHYWATLDEEEAYAPSDDLPDRTGETGELLGALQFTLTLLPRQKRKIRMFAGFDPAGADEALAQLRRVREDGQTLQRTLSQYRRYITRAMVQMPDAMLTHGVQWAKTNMMRSLARYPVGPCFTNDPGHSTHLVGRDIAWFTHGCDYIDPDRSCPMLQILADHQRDDGLIAEYVDGRDGSVEDHGFNVNDNTPLFVIAVEHHVRVCGHSPCMDRLYEPAQRAAELLLRERDERGLVWCTATGQGPAGICSWRNALQHGQITGAVTEINAEAYAALAAMARLAEQTDQPREAERYRQAAADLREAINEHLVDHRTDLYVRNIGHGGRTHTQATADLVFPLMFNVADDQRRAAITTRLFASDFMADGGIRVLPQETPRYNPSEHAGLLGGVWPGVTWWFAMGSIHTHAGITADSLRRSYAYYVRGPKAYDTVPGQFSEWCDGQTLVNRGMRLSPWAPPRFLWTAIEGLAGIKVEGETIRLEPRLPRDWSWMRVHDLPVRDRRVSFVLVREKDQWRLVSAGAIESDMPAEVYEAEVFQDLSNLATGTVSTAFRRDDERLMFLGSTQPNMLAVPLMTHHLLHAHRTYHVDRLTSLESFWEDLGEMTGDQLQRVIVRLEPNGYALYRFRER